MTRNLPDEAPAEKKPRSKRIYVYWGVALALLLALGLFCWLVVVPVLRVPSEFPRIRAAGFNEEFLVFPDQAAKKAVQAIGGPARSGLALRLYLWLHDDSPDDGDDGNVVVYMMGFCGRQVVPVLVSELDSKVSHRFVVALHALGTLGPEATDAVPALAACLRSRTSLERCWVAETLAEIGPGAAAAIPMLTDALNDEDEVVRALCADALGEVGPASRGAISRLERLASGDKSDDVRQAAAEALKKIKAAQEKK